MPRFKYEDNPAFQNEQQNWGVYVEEATKIMKYKIQYIRKNIEFIKDNCPRALDIGCSEGIYVQALSNLGFDAYGFEVDEPKVARARDKGLKITTPQYEKFKGNSFDFIMSRQVLEHIPNFMKILEDAVFLLKPGGVLYVETPNLESLLSLIKKRKIGMTSWGAPGLAHVYPPTHIHGFTPTAWDNVGEKLGLREIDVITYAPTDGNWTIQSFYKRKLLNQMFFFIGTIIGRGENVAVTFIKPIEK